MPKPTKRLTHAQLAKLLAQPGYASLASGACDPLTQQAHRDKPLRDDGPPQKSSGRIIVCITRHSSGTLDRDNLWGGTKAICDALRYAGYIPDDDTKTIFSVVRQQKCKKTEAGTEILILV